MIIACLCIFAVILIIALIWNSIEVGENNGLSTIILAIASGVFTAFLCAAIMKEQPQAIDVYRGNTTLEITYRDSIPVDSVVVFKD